MCVCASYVVLFVSRLRFRYVVCMFVCVRFVCNFFGVFIVGVLISFDVLLCLHMCACPVLLFFVYLLECHLCCVFFVLLSV